MLENSPVFSGYSVNDLSAARSFYIDQLGCPVDNNDMGLMLRFSNGHRVFLYEKFDHTPAEFTVLNFPVASIDTAVDQLVEKGIKMERYDTLPAPLDDKGILRGKAAGMGSDIAWFKDPAGNVLSIFES